MKIHLSVPDSEYFVRRYQSGLSGRPAVLTLNQTDYTKTLCVHKNHLLTDLPIKTIDDISEELCEELSLKRPQVFLLGTGETQNFSAKSKLKAFIDKQIGIEIMTTDAAARTYNILSQEGRDVMALFILA
jgi:uncharacterized protein